MNRKLRLEAAVPACRCTGMPLYRHFAPARLAAPERHGSVKVGDAV